MDLFPYNIYIPCRSKSIYELRGEEQTDTKDGHCLIFCHKLVCGKARGQRDIYNIYI